MVKLLFISVLLITVNTAGICAEKYPFMEKLDELLRNRIETADYSGNIKIGNEYIYSRSALPLFYEKRGYKPAWLEDNGSLSKNAHDLIQALKDSYNEGLTPSNYHIDKIESFVKYILEKKTRANLPKVLVEIDILLTDSFLIYSSHLVSGKVNPETIDSEWIAVKRERDLTEVLEKALKDNNIEKSLSELLPDYDGYRGLRDALKKYRKISVDEGWQQIPSGKTIKPGEADPRVPVICERLSIEKDFRGKREDIDIYDEILQREVKEFQKRYGLEVTGEVDAPTLNAMSVSAGERIKQILVNLERWRWLPQELGDSHVIVNIAGFELDVIDDKKKIMDMRVIVGRDYRRTPVFSDRITYLVLNPYWHVPDNIAVQDIIQKVLNDKGYLSKQNMKVFQGLGSEAMEIDPSTIEWDKLNENNFPYRLRQEPGPMNALGKVKFMFPNKFNVYLHDTSSPDLFIKNVRTFSSGCIRIEKPLALARYLMGWKEKELEELLKYNTDKTIKLTRPLPIHILYWTAWVDGNGDLNFREDIYMRDGKLYETLKEEYRKNDKE
ncbi:MAG: L,D-transpeptidase family protein [Elusimicrobiota bacterium]